MIKTILSLCFAFCVLLETTFVLAGQRSFVYIDKLGPARVLSVPDKGNEMGRIPANSKVEIFETKEIQSGRLLINWYKVKHKDSYGWISQYVTTGKIITEDTITKKASTASAPNADAPKVVAFSPTAKENFKQWALKSTAVTYLEYPENSNWQIWVRLRPEKYTSKENLEQIALSLAQYYKTQTGFNDFVIVTIWHYSKNEIVAKGKL